MSKGRKPAKAPPPSQSPADNVAEARPVFEIKFTRDAGAEIQALDGSVRQQLKKVLEKKLALEPEGYGLPLRGILASYWKHEFADHRIIYRIYKNESLVVVCAVGPRKAGDREDIYRQLEAVAKTGHLAEQVASVLKSILPPKK